MQQTTYGTIFKHTAMKNLILTFIVLLLSLVGYSQSQPIDPVWINSDSLTTNTDNEDLKLVGRGTGAVKVDDALLVTGEADIQNINIQNNSITSPGGSVNIGNFSISSNTLSANFASIEFDGVSSKFVFDQNMETDGTNWNLGGTSGRWGNIYMTGTIISPNELVLNADSVDFSGKKAVNAADPENPGDLVTKSYADANYTTGEGGDVTGPASSTDNAIVRFDGTTGKIVQNSGATLSDAGLASFTNVEVGGSPVVVDSDIGVNVQAWDQALDDISGLAVTDGNIIVGDGANWVAESGATARTSLGLGTIATQNANSVAITGGTIDNTVIGGTTAAAGSFTTGTIGTGGSSTNLLTVDGLQSDVTFAGGNTNNPIWHFNNTGSGASTRFRITDANNSSSRNSFEIVSGAGNIFTVASSGSLAAGAATFTGLVRNENGDQSRYYANNSSLTGTDITYFGENTLGGSVVLNDGAGNGGTIIRGYGESDFFGGITAGAGIFTVDSEDYTLKVERQTINTTGNIEVQKLVATSEGDMTPGFGPTLDFAIQDNAGSTENIIGRIGAIRQGSDTEGALIFKAGTNGDEELVRISSNGAVGIGTASLNNPLHVMSSLSSQQFRVSYDVNNYLGISVANDGATTLNSNGSGGGYFSFSDPVTIDNLSGTGERLTTSTSGGELGNIANGTDDQILTMVSGSPEWADNSGGDVTGPASSTDNAIARFDATTGKIIQNSGIMIDDANNILSAEGMSLIIDSDDNQTSRLFSIRQDGTSGDFLFAINEKGNATIGGYTDPTGAVNVLSFDGATKPSSPVGGNFAHIYSLSGEMTVMDAAGNESTISPHNFSKIPEGPSEEMAWSFYSERDGKYINVDMAKAVRTIERQSQEIEELKKLVYELAGKKYQEKESVKLIYTGTN